MNRQDMKNENQKIMIAASHRFHNHKTFPFPPSSQFPISALPYLCSHCGTHLSGFWRPSFSLPMSPFTLSPAIAVGLPKALYGGQLMIENVMPV